MSGIFGAVSKKDCSEIIFYGTDYHSHLGSQFGGMAVLGDDFTRQIHSIAQSQFKSKFFEDYPKMKGTMGIGVVSASEEQPIYLSSRLGPFCLVTTGYINNSAELADKLMQKGISFSEVKDGNINCTELVAKLINQGANIIDGIEKMFDAIDGACSLLLLNKDGIFVARDRFGYSPLTIGRKGDSWAVSVESCAFPNIDFTPVKYIAPGEIILLNENGMAEKRGGSDQDQICSFLWIYTGFPASTYDGINVETVRERSGAFLAQHDKDIAVDVVSGVPDSGIAHAIGYAMESKKPFRRPLVKYTPGYGRSYIPPTQTIRDHIAKMKLIAVKEIISGNRIVVCEDSIVRGTQLKNFTIKKLWEAGAKEIHVRPACPPLMFPCKFTQSTRTTDELAARKAIRSLEGKDIENVEEYVDSTTEKYRNMVEWIRKDIDVTTLRYQTVSDMVSAISLPKEKLCLYCWTGKCSACGAAKVLSDKARQTVKA